LPAYPVDVTLDFAAQVGTTGTAPASTNGKVRFCYYLGTSQTAAETMTPNDTTDTGQAPAATSIHTGLISGAATVGSIYVDSCKGDDTSLTFVGPVPVTTQNGTLNFSATSSLTLTGTETDKANITFSSTSTLTLTGDRLRAAALNFASTSTLSYGSVGTGAKWDDSVSTWDDSATVWDDTGSGPVGGVEITRLATVSFDSVSTFSLSGTITHTAVGTINFDSVSTLTATAVATRPAAITFNSVSSIAFTGVITQLGTLNFASTSTLVLVGDILGSITANVLFSSVSTLSMTAFVEQFAVLSFNNVSTLTLAIIRQPEASLTFNNTSTLLLISVHVVIANIAFSAVSAFTITSSGNVAQGTILFSATDYLTLTATVTSISIWTPVPKNITVWS